MPKTKRKPYLAAQPSILWSVIGLLVLVCGALTLALAQANRTPVAARAASSISLGTMQYRFEDGKAIKRDDASVNDLRAFLNREAARSGCPAQSPGYEHVVTYTQDESQVFIKYGCGAADSPIYAVKTGDVWKSISPTNHFDYLGLPACDYLTANNISSEIAPVCANGAVAGEPTGTPTYSVR